MASILDPVAGRLASASEIAYDHDTPSIKARLDSLGFELERRFPATTQRHFTCIGNVAGRKTRIVVFRGTEKDWADVLSDIDARWFSPSVGVWPGPPVDEGFWRDLDAYWLDLLKIISQGLPVIFTGHSLGAALAILAGARAAVAKVGVLGVVAFAPPAVSTARLMDLCQRFEVRWYQNCCDVVPKMPPWWLRYRQIGERYYINRMGEISLNPSRAYRGYDQGVAYLAAAERIAEAPGELGRWAIIGLQDHRIAGYVKATGLANP